MSFDKIMKAYVFYTMRGKIERKRPMSKYQLTYTGKPYSPAEPTVKELVD